jgi:hypothetical protein
LRTEQSSRTRGVSGQRTSGSMARMMRLSVRRARHAHGPRSLRRSAWWPCRTRTREIRAGASRRMDVVRLSQIRGWARADGAAIRDRVVDEARPNFSRIRVLGPRLLLRPKPRSSVPTDRQDIFGPRDMKLAPRRVVRARGVPGRAS